VKCKCGKDYDVMLDYAITSIDADNKGLCLYCLSDVLSEYQLDQVLKVIKDDAPNKCDGKCSKCSVSTCVYIRR
jgi:hypothetical protein